jgi:hypothetical protein
MKKQSLSDYTKFFRVVKWFICAMPIGGWLIQNRIAFFFPPLGDSVLTGLALTISTLLAGIAGLLPWKLKAENPKTPLLTMIFFCALGSALAYFYLSQKYVISTAIPDRHPFTVSVGSVRSNFAQENLHDYTDIEMLQQEGPYEERVQKLWTKDSILSVRFWLFLSYLGWLIPLNFIVGIFAKQAGAEVTRN